MRYRILAVWAILIIVLIAVPLIVAESDKASEPVPTVDEVLDRYIEALGGRDALEKLTTRTVTGTQVTDLMSREWSSYEKNWVKGYSRVPNSYYMAIGSYGIAHADGFDGKVGWTKDECGVKVNERLGPEDRLAWVLNPQSPLQVDKLWPGLKYEGTEIVRGMTVYVLNTPGMHRPMFFDSATGLLVAFGHNFEIDDYREVDGVMVPHRILASRKGGSTVYEFDEVFHNEPLGDTLFAMPATDSD